MAEIRLGARFLSIWIDTPADSRAPRSAQRKRLIKPLVQELGGTLPGNASSLGVILRAILLEEPMLGPWIRVEAELPPRSLELLLHLGDRLSRFEGVILREVAEVCGVGTAIVESWVRSIKGHDCGDLPGQGNGRVERVGATQRESDDGEFTATVLQLGRTVLAQDLHRCCDTTAY